MLALLDLKPGMHVIDYLAGGVESSRDREMALRACGCGAQEPVVNGELILEKFEYQQTASLICCRIFALGNHL